MNKLFVAASAALLIASTLFAAPAYAYDRSVKIINDTSVEILHIYAGNVRDGIDYSNDLLGEEVIESGDYFWVDPEDYTGYCKYYFVAYFSDGDVLTSRRPVNACDDNASWRLYDN